MESNERAARIEELLKQAGINVRRTRCIGASLHVDSYEKYDLQLRGIFCRMGATRIQVLDGRHMDGTEGYRIVASFA
ncbi:hypothetical protein L0Z42_29770 [Burkholderia multivorans]|uniref:hypothetical protein n=1 Tax=Burkholderia multivorans TaxID=87883 RepID=UPI0020187F32|nr:hypothetical protein [Burkholderia multivorans]MCO1374563.1 hypothetical protein [Burkholderia multivorans]MCO1374673.1 hypothetical protein [Burkholderia multivorans]MCO1459814.1 hypothetical protein [Burkholderia multivorans]MCO1470742.1 hypothetical protein [Burkholderia multivorans]UQO21183.1 hypothetical protein L0Z02_29140 [Burkholderia multivorans]